MLDFKKLFEKSFKAKEHETGRVVDAVQMTAPFESACPDKFTLQPITKTEDVVVLVFDPTEKKSVEKIETRTEQGLAKVFDQEAGDFHGGNIRGRRGDYILFDGDGFFVVREKNEQGVPVFDKRFMKL